MYEQPSLCMNIKTDKPASSNLPKKVYQPPRLVTFGKLNSIVTGGSGVDTEGKMMTSMMRRS